MRARIVFNTMKLRRMRNLGRHTEFQWQFGIEVAIKAASVSKEARASLGAILDEQECKYLPKYLRTQKTSGEETRETEGKSTMDGWHPITEFSCVVPLAPSSSTLPWSIASSLVDDQKVKKFSPCRWTVPGSIWFASKVRRGTAWQERPTEQRSGTRGMRKVKNGDNAKSRRREGSKILC